MTRRAHVTRSDILTGLRDVGIQAGDVVLMHSSLSAFGWVEGGADAVIDAVLEAVGEAGTIVVPTFTWGPFHDAETAVLDLERTPVKDEVGIIPETFRRRPDARRSTHMCHSVAAIGPHTDEVMGEGVSSFGEGSSFDRLYQLDSWNLLLGVGFTSCTALHAVEERAEVPYRYHRTFYGSTVVMPDGTELASNSIELLRYGGYRNDFGKMRQVLGEAGVLRVTTIGEAEVINVRIRDIMDVTMEHMRRDIGFLLTPTSAERMRHEFGG
ncbi:MAG: AAC(3) family N-acetyltransferase [Armatimonadota bacterium]|nr:AAC(3) family N-acetyltransferase [Armatimonadota bacterium]